MGDHILLVSERHLIADALRLLLEEQPNVDTCDVAGTVEELVARASGPLSILIVDLDAMGPTMDTLRPISERLSGLHRVGFYDVFTAKLAETAFDLSLTTLLPLTSSVPHVLDALLGRRRLSSSTVAEGLTRGEFKRLSTLTAREVEVLQHLADGRPVKAVAMILGITPHTVETHKRRTLAKLGVHQQTRAVAMAVAAGIIAAR